MSPERLRKIQDSLLSRWHKDISTALLLEMTMTDTDCTMEEVCEAFSKLPESEGQQS